VHFEKSLQFKSQSLNIGLTFAIATIKIMP
jgi:hypothetical protein